MVGLRFVDGLLPAEDFELTLEELASSALVENRDDIPQWDTEWRRELVTRLGLLSNELWQVGIKEIYVNGSFVEDKAHPNDIDGYFVCDPKDLASGRLERELNLLNPHKIWTWDPSSRKPYPGYTKRQLPMWHQYRVELFPHYGQGTGILDRYGNELEFPAAFRTSKEQLRPKGIVKLRRSS